MQSRSMQRGDLQYASRGELRGSDRAHPLCADGNLFWRQLRLLVDHDRLCIWLLLGCLQGEPLRVRR
jgi:hypothetical protein